MESRFEKASGFLETSVEDLRSVQSFEDERMAVEADMIAGLYEEVTLGWMTPEVADQLIIEWRERYGQK